MFYFVTSWYGRGYEWHASSERWYDKREKMEFDDSINQIKMFTVNKVPSCLLILNYFPTLRSFLHRQEIYHVPYINVFDQLQGIKTDFRRKISFRDLNWDKNVDFRYTLFNVWAYKNDEVIAYIEFSYEGNLELISWLNSGEKEKDYLFDDRGFLSSIRYYNGNGEVWYQDYFNVAGQRQFREYFNGKGIVVFEGANYSFEKQKYANLDELITEWVFKFKQQLSIKDTVVVTGNEIHNNFFIGNNLAKLVISFFNQRYDLANPALKSLLAHADLAVVATHQDADRLKALQSKTAILEMAPFDSRLKIGKSQQTANLKLLYWLGNQTDSEILASLPQLFFLLEEFPNLILTFASYHDEKARISQLVNGYLKNKGKELEYSYRLGEESKERIDDLGEENHLVQRVINFLEVTSEQSLLKELEFTRLIVDLSSEPDLFLQIAGISAGIPQIDLYSSPYLEHQKNGLLISDVTELKAAVEYYFKGLKNWNRAMMYAVNKITEYTSGKLVEKWKELLGD